MGKNLIKKHSKFGNFNKIFYCGMTLLKNRILNSSYLCQNMKAIKPKKVVKQSFFKNHLKFPYSIEYFTAT